MSTAYYDYSVDPVTNQIYPVILRSASKGGSTTNKIGVIDVNVPAAANFPSSFTTSTPSRYFVELPMDAYWTSTNTASFSVRNETQGRNLTVISPAASLTDYTCKFATTAAEKKSILEVHVGSTSNMANDTLSYEGYFAGTTLKSTIFDHVQMGSITFNSTATVEGNIYQVAGYKIATNGETSPDVDFGGITLYSTTNKYISVKTVQTAHGITSAEETDTKFMIRDAGAGGFGGVKIRCFSSRSEPFQFESYASGTTDTGTNSFVFDAYSSTGGTGSTSIHTSAALMVFENRGTQVAKIFGSGKILTQSDLTVCGNMNTTGTGQVTGQFTVNNFINSTIGFRGMHSTIAGTAPTNAALEAVFSLSSVSTGGFLGLVTYNSGTTQTAVVFSNGTTNYYYQTLTKAL